jgi:hypothetical protein
MLYVKAEKRKMKTYGLRPKMAAGKENLSDSANQGCGKENRRYNQYC